MKSQLYIPKKLKIGYQKREGTFTGKLAYVIYYDDKNVLRKEKSWESWRHKDIEPNEFDNAPMSGFVINKDVSRYNWGHFSSNKSYIRIHDPRGFEFEISPENLIGILMNGDCSRRTLIGDFVYSWHGTDLVLLPCNSEEYQTSSKFTALQGKKIGVKDLVPGCAYQTKKEGTVVYMGKFNWYEFTAKLKDGTPVKRRHYSDSSGDEEFWHQSSEKKHIFYIGSSFYPKSSLDFLAEKVTTEAVTNYADLMDQFNQLRKSSKIVEIFAQPTTFSTEEATDTETYRNYRHTLAKDTYFTKRDGYFVQLSIHARDATYDHTLQKYVRKSDKFSLKYSNSTFGIMLQDDVVKSKYFDLYVSQGLWGNRSYKEFTESELRSMNLFDVYARLENGKVVQLDGWSSFRD